jgi:hypothetical protein
MTDTVTIPKAATPQLEKDRTAAAAKTRQGITMQAAGCLLAGQGLIEGGATFTGDDAAGFRAWAVSVSRKSWKTCESYIAVAKAHGSLTTKADRTKAEGLTFEQLQVLASTPQDDRKEFLAGITKDTTPEDARAQRDALKESRLSPAEKKEREKARKEREKKGKAEKTEAAKDATRDFLKGKKIDNLTPEQLILIGVLVGSAHGADHGADGVKAYFSGLRQVAEQLKERDAAKDAGK